MPSLWKSIGRSTGRSEWAWTSSRWAEGQPPPDASSSELLMWASQMLGRSAPQLTATCWNIWLSGGQFGRVGLIGRKRGGAAVSACPEWWAALSRSARSLSCSLSKPCCDRFQTPQEVPLYCLAFPVTVNYTTTLVTKTDLPYSV